MTSIRSRFARLAGPLQAGPRALKVGYGIAAASFASVFLINANVAQPLFVFAVIALAALLAVGLGASLLRRAPLLALAAILGTLGVFATVYRALAVLDATAIPNIHDAWDAIYFSFVVGSTAGFGDIVPMTAFAKMMVVFELLIVGTLIATTAAAAFRNRRSIDGAHAVDRDRE